MKIGIDIDGVIANADALFRRFLSRLFNRRFPKAKVTDFFYEKVFNLTDQQINEFWEKFSAENLWLKIRLLPFAKESVNYLATENEIYIITSRPKQAEEATIKWLNLKKIKYHHLIFTTNFKNKFDAVFDRGIKLDYHLEDRLDFAIEFAMHNIPVILFDYPWNQTRELNKKIIRVKGWKDALEIFKKKGS